MMNAVARKRIRATVTVQPGDSPIVLGFGPAINLEATVAEAHDLAVQLVDALGRLRDRETTSYRPSPKDEQARRGGGGG